MRTENQRWALKAAKNSLGSQSSPQEKREGKHQQACAGINIGTCGQVRGTLFIVRGPRLVTTKFALIGDAAGCAALAPIAANGVAGIGDGGERG